MNRSFSKTYIAVIFLSLLIFMGCGSSSQKLCTFALVKDGKTYVYSATGAFIAKNKIENGEAPPIVPGMGFVHLSGENYANPDLMEDIVNIISGNLIFFEKKEISSDGYITEGENEVFEKEVHNEATEKIGQQRSVVTITLRNKAGTKSHVIEYARRPEVEAIKNCEVRKVRVVTSPAPGETVSTREKAVLVPIKDLTEFFDPGMTVEYDDNEAVVYFKKGG